MDPEKGRRRAPCGKCRPLYTPLGVAPTGALPAFSVKPPAMPGDIDCKKNSPRSAKKEGGEGQRGQKPQRGKEGGISRANAGRISAVGKPLLSIEIIRREGEREAGCPGGRPPQPSALRPVSLSGNPSTSADRGAGVSDSFPPSANRLGNSSSGEGCISTMFFQYFLGI